MNTSCKKPTLRVSGLSKLHRSRHVFQNVSFDLHHSEVLFLVGPSGVGKTTALRLIANLDPSDSGMVYLNGKTPADLGYAQWRRQVMYVPQHRIALTCTPKQLFLQTMGFRSRKENKFDADTRVEEFVRICEGMGLGRESIVKQKWSELSGGQAQRACVGLCIASKPEVLLLDEPSSSCDHQSALLVEKAILDSGIASVWVSHDVGQPERVGGCRLKRQRWVLQDSFGLPHPAESMTPVFVFKDTGSGFVRKRRELKVS